ncbi:MAG: 4Fe-4S binding protein [Alphaproteobacteria bacterium]|uniref:4Fe-4S binding protein n=1 Tax=Candidatus Nitrobium versatile TaxID=2884831 RepID=A0A953J324_9BACT|nr:4Fe-4S binding protein [Candidatus Nitrobium versatile]
MQNTGTKKGSPGTRYMMILIGIALFLPPLAIIPQTAGEVNLCGSVCPRMFFILSPAGILEGFRNNMQAMWFGASLVGLILLTTFLMGRLWCSHLCPIGGTTELVSRGIPERLKTSFSFLHAPAFRYAYFIVFIAGMLAGIGGIACKLCNFRVVPFMAGSLFVPSYRTYLFSSVGLAGIATVSLTGFFARGGRGYCNLLCPVGALDSMVNYLSERLGFTRKVRTDLSKCNGCGKCIGECMVWALERSGNGKIKRDQASCMSCKECIHACPQEAIRYGRL